MRMNQDLLEVFLEIICLKNKEWGIRNKSWWICRYWYTLDCFILQKKTKLFISIALELNIFLKKLKIIVNKNIKANIFWVQAKDSIMCEYFCIGFIDFMLADKNLTDFTNLFSPYDFNKNDSIILSYFKDAWNR